MYLISVYPWGNSEPNPGDVVGMADLYFRLLIFYRTTLVPSPQLNTWESRCDTIGFPLKGAVRQRRDFFAFSIEGVPFRSRNSFSSGIEKKKNLD